MFAFAVLAVLAVVVVLFAHNWGIDTGPGVLTKVKIFITHCQVWPPLTPRPASSLGSPMHAATLVTDYAASDLSTDTYKLQHSIPAISSNNSKQTCTELSSGLSDQHAWGADDGPHAEL